MSKLKPCPFCGEIPKIESYPYTSLIACRNADCKVAPRIGAEHSVDKLGEAEKWLAEVWNRRMNDV